MNIKIRVNFHLKKHLKIAFKRIFERKSICIPIINDILNIPRKKTSPGESHATSHAYNPIRDSRGAAWRAREVSPRVLPKVSSRVSYRIIYTTLGKTLSETRFFTRDAIFVEVLHCAHCSTLRCHTRRHLMCLFRFCGIICEAYVGKCKK